MLTDQMAVDKVLVKIVVLRRFAPMSNSPHFRNRQLAPYQVLVSRAKAQWKGATLMELQLGNLKGKLGIMNCQL